MGRIHATNLGSRCRLAELGAVFDVDEQAARRVADEHDVPWVSSYAELLAKPEIDAVAVTTPTGTHAELSIKAARAGKHVFCEKPISLERETTTETIDAVRETGMKFQIGFHRRFDPDWVAVAERMRAGELGEVYLFRTSLRDMRPPKVEFLAGSGGFFTDVTIHDLDTARWLVGEITEISAHGAAVSDPAFAEIGDVDTAVVVLRFANGALGVIDNSRAAGYGYECSTEIMGSLATARIDHPHRHHYEWRTEGQAAYPLVRDFEERYPEAYAAELDGFAECVLEDREPRVTGQDALAAFDLARAADTAWREGRTVTLRSGDYGS